MINRGVIVLILGFFEVLGGFREVSLIIRFDMLQWNHKNSALVVV